MAAALRIFSYLPNPRVAKATIAAALCGVEVEVRGTSIPAMQDWLWDFDAHPLSDRERIELAHLVDTGKTGFSSPLHKTEAFMEAHPFGTVPAAFGADGKVGIFESNSILRAVARLGDQSVGLYGHDAYEASRIDSFLDLGLLFGREAQRYILGLRGGAIGEAQHAAMREAYASWMSGIERALANSAYIAGEGLSLADIAFVAELALFHNERNFVARLHADGLAPILDDARFPKAFAHFATLLAQPIFAAELGPYLSALPLR